MNGHKGKDGAEYKKQEAFCLETQKYPDAINREGVEGWPSAVLKPGETYKHVMVHTFTTE